MTQLEILKKTLNSRKLSPSIKERIQKESGFGMCCLCGGIATQTANYDCQGANRIERYCESCVEKQFSLYSESSKYKRNSAMKNESPNKVN